MSESEIIRITIDKTTYEVVKKIVKSAKINLGTQIHTHTTDKLCKL